MTGTFTVTTSGTTPKITLTGALPSGVTFTDNGDGTAKISGTPAANAPGVYPSRSRPRTTSVPPLRASS